MIRSCVKMSYSHAQEFIENPEKHFSDEELPPISNGYDVPHVMESVLNLNEVRQLSTFQKHYSLIEKYG